MKKMVLRASLLSTSFLLAQGNLKENMQTHAFEHIFEESNRPLKNIKKIIVKKNDELKDDKKKEEVVNALKQCEYQVIENADGQEEIILDLSPLDKDINTQSAISTRNVMLMAAGSALLGTAGGAAAVILFLMNATRKKN